MRPGRAIRAGRARTLAHPPGGEDPDGDGDEVDITTLTREELVDLMDELDGPSIDAALSLEEARAAAVGFLQTGETVDIEDLSVDGLRALMVYLGGPVIAEDAPPPPRATRHGSSCRPCKRKSTMAISNGTTVALKSAPVPDAAPRRPTRRGTSHARAWPRPPAARPAGGAAAAAALAARARRAAARRRGAPRRGHAAVDAPLVHGGLAARAAEHERPLRGSAAPEAAAAAHGASAAAPAAQRPRGA